MAEEDSIPMVPSHLIPGRDDMISLLDGMGMGHLVPEQAAPVAPEVRPVPGTRFPPLKMPIISGTPPGPSSGSPPEPAPGTYSQPAAAIPSPPASVAPENNPRPAARGPPSAGETGAGVRGPAVFADPASPGEQYELSTANTIVFLRACDRAQKGLTQDELVQFRHLWLKVYGNRV